MHYFTSHPAQFEPIRLVFSTMTRPLGSRPQVPPPDQSYLTGVILGLWSSWGSTLAPVTPLALALRVTAGRCRPTHIRPAVHVFPAKELATAGLVVVPQVQPTRRLSYSFAIARNSASVGVPAVAESTGGVGAPSSRLTTAIISSD